MPDRDADVLHRFEQRRLRFRRGAVDLVGEHDVRENRPGLELEERPAVRVLLDDVGADDVGGHQVGRELDARERQVQHVGERVDEARLADAGNALEQHVAAREQAGDREVHDLLVADDPAPDFLGDAEEAVAELIDGLLDGGGCRHCLRMKYVWTAVRAALRHRRRSDGTPAVERCRAAVRVGARPACPRSVFRRASVWTLSPGLSMLASTVSRRSARFEFRHPPAVRARIGAAAEPEPRRRFCGRVFLRAHHDDAGAASGLGLGYGLD